MFSGGSRKPSVVYMVFLRGGVELDPGKKVNHRPRLILKSFAGTERADRCLIV